MESSRTKNENNLIMTKSEFDLPPPWWDPTTTSFFTTSADLLQFGGGDYILQCARHDMVRLF